MAAPTFNRTVGDADGSVVQITWTLTTADPTGLAIEFTEWADHTWSFTSAAAWGTSTAKVQGSHDNTYWIATGLSNAAGGLEFSAAVDKQATIIERPRYIRPILTTPGTAASVTVVATLRRAHPLRT